MKVVLEIHEKYARVLTFTAIGLSADGGADVNAKAVDLHKGTLLKLDQNGTLSQHVLPEDQKED